MKKKVISIKDKEHTMLGYLETKESKSAIDNEMVES